MNHPLDVAIIGAGPGGYTCAIRLAQQGFSVAIFEKEAVGGTCLNRGCIPTKALLTTAQLLSDIGRAKRFGIEVEHVSLDFNKAVQRKDRVVQISQRGIVNLLKTNNILYIEAEAVLQDANTLIAEDKTYTAKHIVLATGSSISMPPIAGIEHCMSSDTALSLTTLPDSIAIVGGGVMGCEFAQLFADLGSKVTVFEMQDRLLPEFDHTLSLGVADALKTKRVKNILSASVSRIEKTEEGVALHYSQDGSAALLNAACCLVVTGRKANLLENTAALGLAVEKGAYVVDDAFQTNISNIYAIGDCNGKIMLAHAASAQGIFVADSIAGKNASYAGATIPSCVYLSPEAASCGLSEKAAIAQYGAEAVCISSFPVAANGKASAMEERQGFVKLVFLKQDSKLLGIHILAPAATELISPLANLMTLNATLHDIEASIYAHPTLSESVWEAAAAGNMGAINIPPAKP